MSNVKKLKESGCIHSEAKLSAAEKKVIEGLSSEEVDLLVKIRNDLTTAATDLGEDDVELAPNVFV